MIDDWLSSHGKCGWHEGPQADFVGERESSEIKRILNWCPQADFVGEREFSGINRKLKNIYPQMSLMDTDGGPQADDGNVNHRNLNGGPQADGGVERKCRWLTIN